MLMLDVRNSIAEHLDRHTLEDVVEVTMRKLRRDHVVPPSAKRSSFRSNPLAPPRVAHKIPTNSID
jgi:hypothetical protein